MEALIPWTMISRKVKRWIPVLLLGMVIAGITWKVTHPRRPVRHRRPPLTPPPPPTGIDIPAPTTVSPRLWVVVVSDGTGSKDQGCLQAKETLPSWQVIVVHINGAPKVRQGGCIHVVKKGDIKTGRGEPFTKSFLLALQQGADSIAVVTQHQLKQLQHMISGLNDTTSLLCQDETDNFLAEEFYGCSSSQAGQDPKLVPLQLCQHSSVAVKALAAVEVTPGTKVVCDEKSIGVVLGQRVYSLISTSLLVFQSKAFWALYISLPAVSEDRFIMNLVFQKLLWLTGMQLMVYPVKFIPKPSKDLNAASQFVQAWVCSHFEFAECYKQLVMDLKNREFISAVAADASIEWLTLLGETTHKLPRLQIEIGNQCLTNTVKFHSVQMTESYITQSEHVKYGRKPTVPDVNLQLSSRLLRDTCSNSSISESDLKIPWDQFRDILLIIVFNKPHYEAIPYLELMYGGLFPYRLYCGPTQLDIKFLEDYKLSFVSYGLTAKGHFPGSFNYICLSLAYQMHYNLSSYLLLGDDTLLNVHHVRWTSTDQVWYIPKKDVRTADIKRVRECRLGMCNSYPHWHWWEEYRNQLLGTLAKLRQKAHTSPVVHECYKQLVIRNGGENRVNGGYADIYHIPQRLAKKFIEIASIFFEEQAFLEIAVPSIIRCLEPPDKIQELAYIQDEFATRFEPWTNFPNIRLKGYIHPAKMGPIATGSSKHKKFLCRQVLPYLYDNYGRLPSVED